MEKASQIYEKYGEKYPLACDLFAWFIFGYTAKDNWLYVNYSNYHAEELSLLALEEEFRWWHEETFEDVEVRLKDLTQQWDNES